MGTWYDLPPEIHHHILNFFCQNVVEEFTEYYPADVAAFYRHPSHLTSADLPQSFKDFSSATLTCRSFHHSIVSIVQIAESSPVEMLSFLIRVRLIHLIDPHISTIPHSIGLLTTWAGVFWKLAAIASNVQFMVEILSSLAYESVATLLPHLGDWVVERSTPVSDEEWENEGYALLFDGDAGDFATTVVFRTGSRTVWDFQEYGNRRVICSIAGLFDGSGYMKSRETVDSSGRYTTTDRGFASRQVKMNKNLLAKFPVFREIHNSQPDTWWLFKLGERWYVVDYKEKRMLGSSCEPIFCYWDDVWDTTSWKLGSEGHEYGRDWFFYPDLDYNLSDYEDDDDGDTDESGASDEDSSNDDIDSSDDSSSSDGSESQEN